MHTNCSVRYVAFALVFVSILIGLPSLLLADDSPNGRQATDPKSITSLPNPSARAVPIEDLFYSRRVSSPA